MGPLVSCLMPTANRRRLAAQAIQYFFQQDYPSRELIVIDDGSDSIRDLMPADDRIRYRRLETTLTMGAKHNIAADEARGEMLIHWDDDDWMAPWRISYQVRQLLHQPSTISGLARLWYYEPVTGRAWKYTYSMQDKPWIAGGTFCYTKDFWRQRPFPDMNEGADTVYIWSLPPEIVSSIDDDRFYVAMAHAGNTSPKKTTGTGWLPVSAETIQEIIGQPDWAFYQPPSWPTELKS